MKTVENSYALASSVRDLNCRGIHLRWSFSLSLFDQRGSSAESRLYYFSDPVKGSPTIETFGCARLHPFGNGKPQKRAGPATRERRKPWRRQAPPFPESVIHRELVFLKGSVN